MAFSNITPQNDYEFSKILNKFVTPSEPITTPDRLFGRDDELKRASRALLDPGKQVFIIGERGVGKTSLANIVASFYQSSDSEPIKTSCAEDTNYKTLISDVVIKALNRSKLNEISTKQNKGLSLPILSKITANFSKEVSTKEKDVYHQINTVADALTLLQELSQIHSDSPIIIVDEFDRIDKNNIRPFSDIIKGISDQKINIKFIFTAVSKTYEQIFSEHESTRRQLEIIELPVLSWDSRINLIEKTLNNFEISIDRTTAIRISAISDGYPHYIHFVLKQLLWNIFENEEIITAIDMTDYNIALNHVVKQLSPEYSLKYNRSINTKKIDCELVLWSTSIGEWIINSLDEMYEAYLEIVYLLRDDQHIPLEKTKFNSIVREFTKPNKGMILVPSHSGRRGEYEFSEKIFKGYIRIQAELHSISIKGIDEKGLIKPVLTQWSSIPLARTGYYQSKQPQGYPRRSSVFGNYENFD
ncbi:MULTISPECIES: ATP-binding protein [Acinetobacter]|nr:MULTISPECIES: ATP-binding protein [Acinetobacter]RZH03343.1 ATP-binding protein [Acinetobacter pittii]